jgi:hypothetical protein
MSSFFVRTFSTVITTSMAYDLKKKEGVNVNCMMRRVCIALNKLLSLKKHIPFWPIGVGERADDFTST